MRLRVCSDAYYVASPSNLYVLTAQGESVITGTGVDQWVDRLLSRVDGTRTAEQLTAAMAADERASAEKLLGLMLNAGLLAPVVEDERDDLTESEEERHAPELDLIRATRPASARRDLARFRRSVCLVTGSGRLPVLTARACLLAGMRRVSLALPGDPPADLRALLEDDSRHPGQHVDYRPLGRDPGQLIEMAARADVVLHVADKRCAHLERLLDEACLQGGTVLMRARLIADAVWLGPVGASDPTSDWPSGWRRLTAMGSAVDSSSTHAKDESCPQVDPVSRRADLALTVTAARLAHELLLARTGAGPAQSGSQLVRVDVSTLKSSVHEFVPHPFRLPAEARDADAFLAGIRALERADPVDPRALSHEAAAGMDSRLGLFAYVSDDGALRLPLHRSQVLVSDPVGMLGPASCRVTVTGAGLDMTTARLRAILRGFAAYGSLMVDPRRLLSVDGRGPLADAVVEPDTVLADLRRGRRAGSTWGYRLRDGRAVPVDARHAFPVLTFTDLVGSEREYRVPRGAVAGCSWREAVEAGLVAQCEQLLEAELATVGKPLARVDMDRTTLSPAGDRLRALLKATGESVTVYDVAWLLDVPAFVFCVGPVTVACTAGVSASQALERGLRRVLLAYQARGQRDDPCTPGDLPGLPKVSRAREVTVPSGGLRGIGELVESLTRRGHSPVVVPLDHDPAVADLTMPFALRVVLSDG